MNFSVEIIADSINPSKSRITTFLLTYERFIHSEILTHRSLSRNSASSRAIPIQKVVRQVRQSPAVPVRWGKNGKGMQDHGAMEGDDIKIASELWAQAANDAAGWAEALCAHGVHKQITNRLLEPFVWMTTLVTATEWENFFSLRVHKDAQPEFQHLAYRMLKAYLTNTPAQKDWTEWHIPFGDRLPPDVDTATRLKIATARAARTSYLTMDGEIDIEKDIALHDRLLEFGHLSPLEHSAMASKGTVRSGNLTEGWAQYRSFFPDENRKCDLHKLLADYEASL